MEELEPQAFLDESKKPVRNPKTGRVSDTGDFYVVAASVALTGDLEQTRDELRAIESDLGVALHYNDLSRSRRIEAVEGIAKIEGWEGHLFETARPLRPQHNSEHRLRAKTMEAAFTTLNTSEAIEHLTLETRSQPSKGFARLDQNDHQTLQRLKNRGIVAQSLTIRHETKAEPLLSLADILAGARTDHLCGLHLDIYPLVSHRIRTVEQVLET